MQVKKRTLTQNTKRTRPASLAGPLKVPLAVDTFPSFSPLAPVGTAALPSDLQNCGRNMTPSCYRALYQIPQPTDAVAGNGLGLFEQGAYFEKRDLDDFYARSAPWVPQGTYPIPALIDGAAYVAPANATDDVTGEADIDIDIGQSLIYPQNVTVYQTDDQLYEPAEVATTNVFNTFLDALDGSYCNYTAYGITGDTPPYDAVYPDPQAGGYTGSRMCGTFKPANYNKRQCNEFMKLGLQGHSLLFSSGDYGVGSFPGDGTDGNDYGCLGTRYQIFNPQYPS
jgi:tripeptidyl-peptidase I